VQGLLLEGDSIFDNKHGKAPAFRPIRTWGVLEMGLPWGGRGGGKKKGRGKVFVVRGRF